MTYAELTEERINISWFKSPEPVLYIQIFCIACPANKKDDTEFRRALPDQDIPSRVHCPDCRRKALIGEICRGATTKSLPYTEKMPRYHYLMKRAYKDRLPL